ncbi:MAG: hypothetical protein R3E12_02730 [Candidatus Eisenbacteria bacterium]
MALLAVGLAIGLVATGLTATDGAAQLLAPPPAPAMPKDLRMHSVLYDANRLVVDNTLSAAEAARRLTAIGLVVDQDLVHVELVGPVGREALSAIDRSTFVQRFRGRIDSAFEDRVDAWLPPDQLIAVADWLPEGFLLERANVPMLDAVAGEGPNDTVINSNGYRDGGANGAGVVIAVIDTQFGSLTSTAATGTRPPPPTLRSSTTLRDLRVGRHSRDVLSRGRLRSLPGATWRLYKVDSVTDLGTVVADAIANGTDVISHSMSWYNLGWADDTGAACTAANQASDAGINFVTSAGNRALDHWEGSFNAGAGDANWHDWSPGDETLAMTVSANSSTTLTLSWNTAGGTFDYDLYLYDATGTNVLASSTNGGNTYESLTWMNSSASATRSCWPCAGFRAASPRSRCSETTRSAGSSTRSPRGRRPAPAMPPARTSSASAP